MTENSAQNLMPKESAKNMKGVVSGYAGLAEESQDCLKQSGTTGTTGTTEAKPDKTGKSAICESKGCPDTVNVQPGQTGAKEKNPPFILKKGGVYACSYDGDGKLTETTWLCSRLEITAETRDENGESWGRLLVFKDRDECEHSWAMPMALLSGSCEELRRELLHQGLEITSNTKVRARLGDYIQRTRPRKKARCVHKTGWHNGVFVFPSYTVGKADERVIFQAESTGGFTYEGRGTLDEWKQNVATLCAGNSRLVFAVSVGFGSSLINLIEGDSGGFHFRGGSSIGKTTALLAGGSLFGAHKYIQRWRATDNGLEAIATQHNDALLILDELGQVDPKFAGEVSYMLANGEGKLRADRKGAARQKPSWRLFFLSAGEISLAEHMRQAGKKARTGQEIRMVDIPADAGQGFGIFEQLHQYSGGAELSQAIRQATAKFYGTAAPAFLRALIPLRDTIPNSIRAMRDAFIDGVLPSNAGGQVHRAAERFAYAAVGGELATRFGVTGWEKGEATKAAERCFKDWLQTRGGAGNQESREMIKTVRRFLEAHGESRFTLWEDKGSAKTINRAGFRKASNGLETYYVLREAFREEVCSGFNCTDVVSALKDAGCLHLDSDGGTTRKERLPSIGSVRCYVITPKIWEV